MRLHFHTLNTPKKAAKRLSAEFPSIRLSQAQRAVAVACGYRDWNELERFGLSDEAGPRNEEMTTDVFRAQTVTLIRSLSEILVVHDGDIQHVMPSLRLAGNRAFTFADHEAIRTAFWRAGPMPWTGRKTAGSTFFRREKGYPPRRAYQVGPGERGVRHITDDVVNSGCADFEARSPKQRMEDFIPLRLWLPYGALRRDDGAEVLFSRDYRPLWVVSPEKKVKRALPSTPLNFAAHGARRWFKDETGMAWHAKETRDLTEGYLAALGISTLPRLVDTLPFLVKKEGRSVDEASDILDGVESFEDA